MCVAQERERALCGIREKRGNMHLQNGRRGKVRARGGAISGCVYTRESERERAKGRETNEGGAGGRAGVARGRDSRRGGRMLRDGVVSLRGVSYRPLSLCSAPQELRFTPRHHSSSRASSIYSAFRFPQHQRKYDEREHGTRADDDDERAWASRRAGEEGGGRGRGENERITYEFNVPPNQHSRRPSDYLIDI